MEWSWQERIFDLNSYNLIQRVFVGLYVFVGSNMRVTS